MLTIAAFLGALVRYVRNACMLAYFQWSPASRSHRYAGFMHTD